MAHQLNSNNVVSDTIDGEVLAIRSDNGAYYSMRGPSATSWVAITSGAPLDLAATAVADHHVIDAATVRTELETFAASLAQEQLIVHAPERHDLPTLPAETAGQPWEPPSFEKYTDMEDLLLFDPIHEVDATGWPSVTTDNAG